MFMVVALTDAEPEGSGKIHMPADGLAPIPRSLHITNMHTDFSVFRERLAEACRARSTTETKLCQGIGLGGRRAITLSLTGPGAIDLYRVCQIADKLDVSTDWLLGRSNVMSVMEMPEDFPEPPKRKAKRLA
jgi:hypothetical protein